ncbi:deoxyuridine 5'-triphosphate nucleotidohydrolase [Campylobacterota bacterium]|nr:deoxyuridine 5'-triphosphate nucleotidohydrolase [Campylobacterota bacterium]
MPKPPKPLIRFMKLHGEAILPQYQSAHAAGFDLHAIEDLEIRAGDRSLVKTGLAIALPAGYELQVRPRSSLALKHGVTVLNSPGTIDADYRGEIMVILFNSSREIFSITKGDRIAQAVLARVEIADFELCAELDETKRGGGGFGSTGK